MLQDTISSRNAALAAAITAGFAKQVLFNPDAEIARIVGEAWAAHIGAAPGFDAALISEQGLGYDTDTIATPEALAQGIRALPLVLSISHDGAPLARIAELLNHFADYTVAYPGDTDITAWVGQIRTASMALAAGATIISGTGPDSPAAREEMARALDWLAGALPSLWD